MAASSSLSGKLNEATTTEVPGARPGDAAAVPAKAQNASAPSTVSATAAAATVTRAPRHRAPRLGMASAPGPGRRADCPARRLARPRPPFTGRPGGSPAPA
jgi:hypothetical protein